MDTKPRARRPPLPESTDSPTQSIVAIRGFQMPQDVCSAFHPEDVVLFCEPRRGGSCASETQARARQRVSRLQQECTWCKADDISVRWMATITLLFWLATSSANIQIMDTVTFQIFKYTTVAASSIHLLLTLVLVQTQCGTAIRDDVCVKFHWLHSLARHMLSPSSLLLLQQPILNMQSFIRYYQFFNHGQPGGPADQDVDSCIRYHLAEGVLARVGLIEEGCALLGMIPCQDNFADSGFGSAQLKVLQRTYQDWKRWRLGALLCERFQARGGVWLEQGKQVNTVERLGGSGRYKWFLVDSQLFSSKRSSQPQGIVASESLGRLGA